MKLFLLMSCTNFLTACKEDNDLTANIDVKFLRQIITNEPSTSRNIIFQTDDILNNPFIDIDGQTFNCEQKFFTDDNHINNQYSVQIQNLKPNQNYQYRIIDNNHCSQWYELKTTNKNFKAIIFPDSQCADYNVWRQVATSAYNQNPDADFFINLGDLVDNGEDFSQWQAWFNGATFLDKIICVPVLGNHEYYSRQWKVREPIAYQKFFDLNDYYSFDFGDVHFSVLNTQWSELADLNVDSKKYIIEQKDWLINDLSSTKMKWKIILAHKDVLQYRINNRPERLEGFSDFGEEFMPIFDDLKVDIVFTGHLHTFRDRGHIFNFKRDSKGPLYILTGLAGDVRYPNLWINHELDEVIAPQPEVDNYLTLESFDDSLIVKCFLSDNTLIDNIKLNK